MNHTQFPSYAQGKIVPHGIYDIYRNEAHIHLGTSRDTTEFACDSLALWRDTQCRRAYPDAKQLLILCDSGGSKPIAISALRARPANFIQPDRIGNPDRSLSGLLFQTQPD
jgi:hypothetical protein